MEMPDLFYCNIARYFDRSIINSTYIILSKDCYPVVVPWLHYFFPYLTDSFHSIQ